MTNSVNSAKDLDSILFDISPKIKELAGLCEANTGIDKELFVKHDVKRGLRDVNGKGVLAGLTNISDVCAKKTIQPCSDLAFMNSSRCLRRRSSTWIIKAMSKPIWKALVSSALSA